MFKYIFLSMLTQVLAKTDKMTRLMSLLCMNRKLQLEVS